MGCRPCKSGKAFMPIVSQLDSHLVQDFTSHLSSQRPSATYQSVSNIINLHKDEIVKEAYFSSENQTPRSCKSENALTASTELKKMLQRSADSSSCIQKEYKIYVWTKNRRVLRNIFPQRSFNETIELNGQKFEANFSIYTSCIPIVVDCIVYILETIEDFKEVYNINQQYKYIWVQALFTLIDHKSMFEVADTLGIQILKSTQELFNKIVSEDFTLVQMLNNIFRQIDDNNNGVIDFDELAKAFQSMPNAIKPEELKDGLKKIDVDKDGKISFEEFCFWWKKGRQGPLSFSESTLKWAKNISMASPETRLLLRKMTMNRLAIEKKLKKKEIFINVGGDFLANTELDVDIGKSSSREKILNEVNAKLSLFSQEVWICVHAKVGQVKNLKAEIQLIKKQAEILLESITANFIDGKRLKKSIECDVYLQDNDFYLSFSIDTENEYMEPVNKLLTTIDEFCTSPTNDSISVKFKSDNFFYQFFDKGSLLTNLGTNTKTTLTLEHWSKHFSLFSSIWPEKFKEKLFLGGFLIGNTRVQLEFKDIKSIFNCFFNENTQVPDISDLLTPGLLHFIHKLPSLFQDDLILFARCGNIGARIKIHSKDLISKLLQHKY